MLSLQESVMFIIKTPPIYSSVYIVKPTMHVFVSLAVEEIILDASSCTKDISYLLYRELGRRFRILKAAVSLAVLTSPF